MPDLSAWHPGKLGPDSFRGNFLFFLVAVTRCVTRLGKAFSRPGLPRLPISTVPGASTTPQQTSHTWFHDRISPFARHSADALVQRVT